MSATVTNFGRDTSCTTGMRTGQLVSGVRLVAEASYRRLSTPRGSLIGGEDEANYGLDLAGKIGSAATHDEVAALPAQVEAELLKDARIETVNVTIVQTITGPSAAWTVTVEATTALGPFSLVLGVADVTVQLLGVQTE
jgi:hypothetical protein